MEEVEITIHIPRRLHAAALRVSGQRGQTLARYLTQALASAVLRTSADGTEGPEIGRGAGPGLTCGRLVSPRSPDGLEQDFARARSWPELQGRLMVKGFRLRQAGGTLWVHDHPDDTAVCPLEALGIAPASLAMRFCRPYPSAIGAWDHLRDDVREPDETGSQRRAAG